MKKIRRILAVLTAAFTALSCTVTAFAEVDREAIINAWFKYDYEAQHSETVYEHIMGKQLPISDNPLAAVDYEWIRQSVALIDDDTLKKIYPDEKSSLRYLSNTFSNVYDYHGIEKGITLLYDYGIEGYEDDIFLISRSSNELLNAEKYRRVVFIDNGDSFTLQTEDGTEQLGTYKKVYGFDTDEDIGYSGDPEGYSGGGTGGGSAGGNANSPEENTSGNDNTTPVGAGSRTTSTSRISSDSSESEKSTKTTSVVSGNNAPVTPEVVSAVDAAKSAKEAELDTETELTTTVTAAPAAKKRFPIWIILVLLIGAVAFLFVKKKSKKSN